MASLVREFPLHRPLSASIGTSAKPNLLHYEWVDPGTDQANDRTTIVFLHGLLGNSRNIKTMAKKLCHMKRTNGLLLDITGHGRSPPNPKASFADVIADLQFTLKAALENKITNDNHALTLVGHSLGGRLSLSFASQAQNTLHQPRSVWLLDTVPGIADASVVSVLQSAKAVLDEASTETRKDLVQRLKQDGHSDATSQWLASQYDVKTKHFNFDVETAESLVRDFGRHDFWMQLESLDRVSVNLVQAGRNPAWNEVLPDMRRLSANHRLRSYLLPDAGHWVHVDDLPGLLKIFESVEDW